MRKKIKKIMGTVMLAGMISMLMPLIASAHTYKEFVKIEPTCTEDGTSYYKCLWCDLIDENTREIIPALGHDYTISEKKQPTCTEDGVVIYTCSRCGDSYTEKGDLALGHNYVESERIEATTQKEGSIMYTCTRCKDAYEEIIPKLVIVKDPEVIPPIIVQPSEEDASDEPLYEEPVNYAEAYSEAVIDNYTDMSENEVAQEELQNMQEEPKVEVQTAKIEQQKEIPSKSEKVQNKSITAIEPTQTRQFNAMSVGLVTILAGVWGVGGTYVLSFRHFFKWVKQNKKSAIQKLYGGE